MKNKRLLKNFLSALAMAALCALIGVIVGCPLKRIFGVPCPGCGITRACLSALKPDLAAAFRWHPLWFLVPLIFAVYVFKDFPIAKKLTSPPVLIGVSVLYIAVYIVRMALYFPSVPPMDFQKNSIIGEIVQHLLLH